MLKQQHWRGPMPDLIFRSDVLVKFRDSMPQQNCDDSIIEAMLVSSDRDEDLVQQLLDLDTTEKRIKFLMQKRHGTPFEHNAMKFYVEAPIFVFREWHRHRIGHSYNEQSARWSELPPMFYVPPVERPLVSEGRPGNQRTVPGTEEQWRLVDKMIRENSEASYSRYQSLIAAGVANEVSRMVLPVNIFSKMVTTVNARSLMHYLSLRTREEPFWEEVESREATLMGETWYRKVPDKAMFPSGPLYEIEQAARIIESVFSALFPITYKAFCEFGRVAP